MLFHIDALDLLGLVAGGLDVGLALADLVVDRPQLLLALALLAHVRDRTLLVQGDPPHLAQAICQLGQLLLFQSYVVLYLCQGGYIELLLEGLPESQHVFLNLNYLQLRVLEFPLPLLQ